MPFPTVPLPPFPDVPIAPGVPPVPRGILPAAQSLVILAADAVQVARLFIGPQWGIFLDGAPAIVGDSVMAVDFRNEWRLSDYPVERGSFATYDKVKVPFDVRVTFAVSGQGGLLSQFIPGGPGWLNLQNRTATLELVEAFSASLALFDVVTPEVRHKSCAIAHYDYRREARQGATLIHLDVWLQEVRIAPSKQFSQTKTDSAAAPTDTGPVQATPPPAPATSTPVDPATTGTGLSGGGGLALGPQGAPSASGTGLTTLPLGPFN